MLLLILVGRNCYFAKKKYPTLLALSFNLILELDDPVLTVELGDINDRVYPVSVSSMVSHVKLVNKISNNII